MNERYNLTNGPILRKLLLVALPVMGTQTLQMVYNLTDMFWLGRIGSDAVAASGTAGMFLWLSAAFNLLGRMGAEIGVSQNAGRGDLAVVRSYGQTAFSIAAMMGVLYAAVMIGFRVPLIGFFRIREAHVAADAALYLGVVALGIPFSFISGALNGIWSGSGNTRVPFAVSGLGLLLNMVLDPLFIFAFGWGVVGAAVATVAAQAVVCAVSLVAVKSWPSRPIKNFHCFVLPDRACLKQVFRWCAPISLESMLFTILTMLIRRLVSDFGSDAIAVQNVCIQIESLTWLLAGGFGSAMTAFVGQNYGAGLWSRIRQSFRLAVLAMSAWGAAVGLLLFFGGRLLFTAFLPDPAIVPIGVAFLKILSVSQIPGCLEAVTAGLFRGLGRTAPPSLASITCNLLRVPLAAVLSQTALGLNGIWWAVSLGAAGRFVLLFLWYAIQAPKMPKADYIGHVKKAAVINNDTMPDE